MPQILKYLQDQLPPFSTDLAKAMVAAELGQSVEAIFAEFSEPVAAASIAQVHKARLVHDDRAVAVKVLRPGIERAFRKDIDAFTARVQQHKAAFASHVLYKYSTGYTAAYPMLDAAAADLSRCGDGQRAVVAPRVRWTGAGAAERPRHRAAGRGPPPGRTGPADRVVAGPRRGGAPRRGRLPRLRWSSPRRRKSTSR